METPVPSAPSKKTYHPSSANEIFRCAEISPEEQQEPPSKVKVVPNDKDLFFGLGEYCQEPENEIHRQLLQKCIRENLGLDHALSAWKVRQSETRGRYVEFCQGKWYHITDKQRIRVKVAYYMNRLQHAPSAPAIIPTDKDVYFGKGAWTREKPGNIAHRTFLEHCVYLGRKYDVALMAWKSHQKITGSRFVECKDGKVWTQVTDEKRIRKKIMQCMRDIKKLVVPDNAKVDVVKQAYNQLKQHSPRRRISAGAVSVVAKVGRSFAKRVIDQNLEQKKPPFCVSSTPSERIRSFASSLSVSPTPTPTKHSSPSNSARKNGGLTHQLFSKSPTPSTRGLVPNFDKDVILFGNEHRYKARTKDFCRFVRRCTLEDRNRAYALQVWKERQVPIGGRFLECVDNEWVEVKDEKRIRHSISKIMRETVELLENDDIDVLLPDNEQQDMNWFAPTPVREPVAKKARIAVDVQSTKSHRVIQKPTLPLCQPRIPPSPSRPNDSLFKVAKKPQRPPMARPSFGKKDVPTAVDVCFGHEHKDTPGTKVFRKTVQQWAGENRNTDYAVETWEARMQANGGRFMECIDGEWHEVLDKAQTREKIAALMSKTRWQLKQKNIPIGKCPLTKQDVPRVKKTLSPPTSVRILDRVTDYDVCIDRETMLHPANKAFHELLEECAREGLDAPNALQSWEAQDKFEGGRFLEFKDRKWHEIIDEQALEVKVANAISRKRLRSGDVNLDAKRGRIRVVPKKHDVHIGFGSYSKVGNLLLKDFLWDYVADGEKPKVALDAWYASRNNRRFIECIDDEYYQVTSEMRILKKIRDTTDIIRKEMKSGQHSRQRSRRTLERILSRHKEEESSSEDSHQSQDDDGVDEDETVSSDRTQTTEDSESSSRTTPTGSL